MMPIIREHPYRFSLIALAAACAFALTGYAMFEVPAPVEVPDMSSLAAATTTDLKLALAPAPSVASAPAPTASVATSAAAPCTLSFSITPSATIIAQGGAFSYSIRLANIGTESCTDVSYSLYYADTETYLSASPAPSASNYYWNVGNLAPGASEQTQVSMQAADASDIAQEACATADNSGGDACVNTDIAIGTSVPVIAVAPSAPSANASPFTAPAGKEFGVWIWDSPLEMSASERDTDLSAAQTAGMNAVYVTIDDYLPIASLPDGASKDAQTTAYMSALRTFITEAHTDGLAVDVEGGDRDWAEAGNTWKGFALIDFVAAYNAANPDEKIRNFQYDVESYLLPAYASAPGPVLTNFIAFIDQSAARMKNVDAGFSVVIPHFYDSVQAWTPEITYGATTAYPYTQLLSVLSQKTDTTIVIMDYRNTFTGGNGAEVLVTPELSEAERDGSATKIVIAQETGNVQPSYVTFYGQTRAALFAQLGTINAGFSSYPNFGGTAVDYIEPFRALK